MADSKPRILQGNRDMIWSMVVLLAGCLVFGLIGGLVTFSPGGKPKPGQVPDFDAPAAFAQDAKAMPYPVRSPALPADWKANSGRTEMPAGQPSTIVGWVTPGGSFVELVQTSAAAQDVRLMGQGPRPQADPIPVAGHEWTIYSGDEVRPMWVLDLGDVRLGISGSAPRSDFETLAIATTQAEPLPRG